MSTSLTKPVSVAKFHLFKTEEYLALCARSD